MVDLLWFLPIVATIGAVLFLVSYRILGFSAPLFPEKKIIVIVPSYNNAEWYTKNLDSILSQEYTSYQLIYINDCSTDRTKFLVGEYLHMRGYPFYSLINNDWKTSRVFLQKLIQEGRKHIVINNSERKGALENLYYAIHACPEDAVIATIDGDDWLKHSGVLKKINVTYQKDEVWMTYGQYQTWPEGDQGDCQLLPWWVVEKNAYRESKWVTSHLRTFYAGLFKQIKKEDLMYEGDFFDVTWDQAFLFPLLEMSAGRIKFIPEVLYVYNQANPINDYKVHFQRQQYFVQLIRSKEKYHSIGSLRTVSFNKQT